MFLVFIICDKFYNFYFIGDKELMQLLFFDAKITHALYNSTWIPTSEFE